MYYGMIFFVFAHVYSSIPKGFLDNNNVVGLVRYHGYCGLTEEASTVAWHRVGDNRSRADTIVIPPYASSWWPPAAFVWARPPPLREMAPLGDDDKEIVNLYDGEGRPRHCRLAGTTSTAPKASRGNGRRRASARRGPSPSPPTTRGTATSTARRARRPTPTRRAPIR